MTLKLSLGDNRFVTALHTIVSFQGVTTFTHQKAHAYRTLHSRFGIQAKDAAALSGPSRRRFSLAGGRLCGTAAGFEPAPDSSPGGEFLCTGEGGLHARRGHIPKRFADC